MATPLRLPCPDHIHFVTARCFQGRLLLRPSEETNTVLGGVLARAVQRTGVELYGFAVASNHLHLLVRARAGNLPEFMQFLLGNVARKIGWLTRWRGALWERRYSAAPVLDTDALLERMRYLLAHGVKEGLVRRCDEWPGLSSLPLLRSTRPIEFTWFNWTRRWNRRSDPDAQNRLHAKWAEPVKLSLSPLPCWAGLTDRQRRLCLDTMVRAIDEKGRADHRYVLGPELVRRQPPHARPERSPRSAQPLCHASSRELRDGFRERYRQFAAAFRDGSRAWRSGVLHARFPDGAVRPFVWPARSLASTAVTPVAGARS